MPRTTILSWWKHARIMTSICGHKWTPQGLGYYGKTQIKFRAVGTYVGHI